MGQTLEGADAVHRMKPGRKPKLAAVIVPEIVPDASQAYALRIWSGQSVDVPVGERLTRVIMGLNGQKMDIPDLSFLHPDADRLLNTPRTK